MTTRRRLSSVPKPPAKQDIVEYAREVIRAEAEAVAQLGPRLNGGFARAVEMVLACPGRVVVTGMGVLAPNGNTLAEFWDSLIEGRSGLGIATSFDVADLPDAGFKDVDIELLASVPGTYVAPATSSYLYYTAEDKTWAAPTQITVQK